MGWPGVSGVDARNGQRRNCSPRSTQPCQSRSADGTASWALTIGPQNASAATAARIHVCMSDALFSALVGAQSVRRSIRAYQRPSSWIWSSILRSMRSANDVLDFWFGKGPMDPARLMERNTFWFGGDGAEAARA